MGPQNGSLPKLLNTILNSFMDLCGCDAGSIYTLRKDLRGNPVLVFETMVTRSIRLSQVPDHLKNMAFAIDENSLVGKTALHRQFLRASFDHPEDEANKKVDNILQYVTRNILSAPLITPRGDLVGVVQLLNKLPYENQPEKTPDFDSRDERLFSIVAGQAALAIENSMLLEEQERLLEGFVNACVTAVEARDPVTSGHSTRVSDYTLALAEAVNRTDAGPLASAKFSDLQLRELRFAAMLHDIGKISVREEVLNKEKKLHQHELEVIRMRLKLMRANLALEEKVTGVSRKETMEKLQFAWRAICDANEPTVLPAAVNAVIQELAKLTVISEDGESISALTQPETFKLSIARGSLTQEERVEIEKHVTNTYEILKMVPWSRGLERVPEIAHKHHEKLDGTGYPLHVPALEIPVQSRMLTICDIHDALTADDRPYKRAVPLDKALDILSMEVKGGKLDPELFRIFVEARVYEVVRGRDKLKKAA